MPLTLEKIRAVIMLFNKSSTATELIYIEGEEKLTLRRGVVSSSQHDRDEFGYPHQEESN